MAKGKKLEKEFEEDAQLKAQPDFLVCWFYDENTGELLDRYKMPNNKDKAEPHLPPHATLLEPPENVKGMKPYFVNGHWELRVKEKIPVYKPVDDQELTIMVPVLEKILVQDPSHPEKQSEDFIWVTTRITPEGEAARATARKEAFHAQQRAWGLEE